ncbi:hypothetical protein B842_06005 [Corynebacterium humireducens NBRC 106098 = DSM 45392]|uniref:Uncharacterized protein n=1 Tax=Corynebacterium humireducens NBRC 106098 = DSM 45392 TaxID=1223515 RepID=A0A0B5D2E1_9CORY|nr:hypothetical protein [Corynebacterium humireducens]AJE33050.1 hypothetical protein B842_06005 [Corynebacterium humireducens NBRC 106098 = DSM 45392]
MNTDPKPTLEEQLEEILADTERRLQELQEQRQREEIDRLPELFATTSNRWNNIRMFIDELMRDLRGRDDGEQA